MTAPTTSPHGIPPSGGPAPLGIPAHLPSPRCGGISRAEGPPEGGIPCVFSLALARLCLERCARSYQEDTISTPLAHGLIQRGGTFDILAFRGSKSLRDWLTDFDIRQTVISFGARTFLSAAGPASGSADVPSAASPTTPDGSIPVVPAAAGDSRAPGAAKLHAGFDRALTSIAPQLLALAQRDTQLPLVVTGHSLGGAMAQLAAQLLFQARVPIAAVYTFGGPRVGNSLWATRYNLQLGARTWRVVDELDLVPRIPFLGYEHAGNRVLLTENSALINPSLWRTIALDAVEEWKAWRARKLAQLTDHPWQSYERRLNYIAALNGVPGN